MDDIKIGEKKSFWNLLKDDNKKNILIPTIQRDYTYGSDTDDTNKVLNNMLSNIRAALFDPNGPEMTMNFIYGFTQNKINYVPLDGQQRLTTLFLLHYYAALFNEEAEIDLLRRFSYATRETTKNYCNEIIDHCKDIYYDFQKSNDISESIHNLPWFMPNYDNDPSIRSMQFVLKKIDQEFSDVKELLWDKLTADNCPVNFYRLDFGPFGLSDDLYVKMNSRGKKLTEYEIFKSSLLKHIDKVLNNKDLERTLATKFDNRWTDLVWRTWEDWYSKIESGKELSLEEKLRNIDFAYINLMKFILKLLSCKLSDYRENPNLDIESIQTYFGTEEYVSFAENVLDTFYKVMHDFDTIDEGVIKITDGLRNIKKDYNGFRNCIGGKNLNAGDTLWVYGEYLAFKNLFDGGDIEEIRINLRHLRNILENSDDEIRKENMPGLIKEVELIIKGEIQKVSKVYFNTNQWNEEAEKHEHLDQWKQLWKYEEHDLLRGSLSNFWNEQTPVFSSQESLELVKQRLDKFLFIFGNDTDFKYDDVNNDRLIRAALLAIADYSQSPIKKSAYRIIGNMPTCWRLMFTKNTRRNNQSAIIDVIDAIDNKTQLTIRDYLASIIDEYLKNPETDKKDWRYYAIKYKECAYKSHTYHDGYGYFYIIPNKPNTLEVAQLASTEFGSSNLAWYFLPQILKEKNEKYYNMFLGNHAANEDEQDIIFNVNSDECRLNISCEGWYIKGLSLAKARNLGISCQEMRSGGGSYLLCTPNREEDYIEYAENNILTPLSKVVGFTKNK